ncbi:MAG: MFS transporter [Nocardioidaceae bacterium]
MPHTSLREPGAASTPRGVPPSSSAARSIPSIPSTHSSPPAPTSRAARIALALILTVQLMVVLDMTVVNVALTDLKASLSFSTPQLSWVLNAYTLAFGGLLLLGARAGDILGRRRVLVVGITVFTLASFAGGLAGSAGALLLARTVQGVGAAIAAPQALSLLTTTFAEGRERTRALGWYAAVSIGGSAIGLIVGGMLTDWVSWRWVFFINVPVGLAIAALTPRYLPVGERIHGRFDVAGAITSTAGMTALVYGFVRAASHGWLEPETVAAFAAGVLLMVAFVLVERRAAQPITPLGLFAHRDRAAAYAGRLLLVAGMMGMFFFLTQFMQEVLGLNPLQTGLAFLPLTAALFMASQLSARVFVETYGARTVMIVGLTLSTTSMVWLATISTSTGYLGLLGPLVLFGLGNGLAFVPLTALGLSGVTPAQAGAASGLINAVQQVGGSLGLSILVTVYGNAVHTDASGPGGNLRSVAQTLTHGTSYAFVGAAVFLAMTLTVVALVARRQTPAPAQG